MTPVRGAASGERGSGTVLALAVAAVTLVLLLGIAALVSAERGRAAAQAGADLAALAAAEHLAGPGTGGVASSACAIAREVATRNGVHLTGCRAGSDGSVQVTAARTVGTVGTASARARAGPADLRPGGPTRGP